MDKKYRFVFWSVVIVAAVTLLPFLHGGNLAMRLSAALSFIVMLGAGAVFFAKRKNRDLSYLASMITLTAYGIHEASLGVSVDVPQTMFLVCALYAFYKWWESDARYLPWLAILCMSGGLIVAGPAGIAVPCFIIFIFMLYAAWQRRTLTAVFVGKIICKILISIVLSFVLPALWYFFGNNQCGDIVPCSWFSAIPTLILGWLPWSIPVFVSLFVVPWHELSVSHIGNVVRKADNIQAFTWLSFLLILGANIFFNIFSSYDSGNRYGMSLLACFPFMAILMTEYVFWLVRRTLFPIRFYIAILSFIGFAVTVMLVVLRSGMVSEWFRGGQSNGFIEVLRTFSMIPMNFGDICLIMLPLFGACLGLMVLLHRRAGFITSRPVLCSTVITLLFFVAFDGFYKPVVMNCKSKRPVTSINCHFVNKEPSGIAYPIVPCRTIA